MKARLTPMQPMLAAVLLLLSTPSFAQQDPLTGQMMSGQRSTPEGEVPASAASSRSSQPASSAPSATAVSAPSPAPADRFGISSPPAAETPWVSDVRAAQIGDTTRHLLQMQAEDHRAGTRLPMLGDEATAGYRRYLRSFSHDIPEFYEAAVAKDRGNGR
ncbi:MAG: DUF3613 domain-containing protein [Rhodanobacter sp.]